MANFNKVFLMGNLTRDPELRYTPSGVAVSDIGLAVNRVYTGADGNQRKEVCFVDITAWKKQAEVICQYLKKGSPIFVEGRLDFQSWETEGGQKRNKLRVVLENFQFIGGKREDDSKGGSDGAPPSAEQVPVGVVDSAEEDIPF